MKMLKQPLQSRVPADNSWHRKILKVSDVEEAYLKTMRVESVVAQLLSYAPVAGVGANQVIVSTADSIRHRRLTAHADDLSVNRPRITIFCPG